MTEKEKQLNRAMNFINSFGRGEIVVLEIEKEAEKIKVKVK